MPVTNKLMKSDHSYLLNRAINALPFELHLPAISSVVQERI